MPKNNIAFDIDGCCVDIMMQVRQGLWNYGFDMDYLNCPQYDCISYFNVPRSLFKYVLVDSYSRWQETPIIDGVEEFFQLLYERSNDYIQFVTSRHVKYSKQTYALIDRFMGNIPYQIAFVDFPGITKADFIVSRYEYFYEDRRKIALDLISKNIKVIMPRYKYNQINWYDWNLRFVLGRVEIIKSIKDLILMIDRFIKE